MKFFSILALASLSLWFSSCGMMSECGSTKDDFLSSMNSFVEDVINQNKEKPFEDADWESYDKQLEQFTGECYDKFEADLTKADKLNIAASSATYLYAKYGMTLVLKIGEQEESIRKALKAIDPVLLLKVAAEVLENPEEIKNIMKDLESRYN